MKISGFPTLISAKKTITVNSVIKSLEDRYKLVTPARPVTAQEPKTMKKKKNAKVSKEVEEVKEENADEEPEADEAEVDEAND